MVALLDVNRAAFGFAFEVAGHVRHDRLEGAPESRNAGIDGARPEGAPRLGLTQPEQEPVAPPGYVEGAPPDVVGLWAPEAVSLHQFLDARSQVGGVMEHG